MNVETVRFYERQGLMPPPDRAASGYRDYDADSVRRLKFIKRAQELGFSLREVGDLLALRTEPGSTCADVKLRATERLEQIRDKLDALGEIHDALQRLVTLCTQDRLVGECPIVAALDENNASGVAPVF